MRFGGRWGSCTILTFSRFSTTLVFRVEDFGVILRGDLGSPRALSGPKFSSWRRCAAVSRSAPSACRTAMVSRPHSSHPQDGASSAHSSRARSAERVGAGAAQQTETVPLNHCVGRRVPCYPSRHAGAARLQRDAITLCRRAPQSSPIRPSRPCQTEGAQLRVGVSA